MNPDKSEEATRMTQATLVADRASTLDIVRSKISEYEKAIGRLPRARKINCEQEAMALLAARDEVSRSLARSEQVPNDLRLYLAKLDRALREHGPLIDECVGSATLEHWRETVQPPATAWWWSLDKLATRSEEKRNLLWVILTGFGLTLSIAFASEISSRFFSGGPDKFGILSTAAQVFLALLAGSSFTQAGRQWLGDLLSSFGIKRKFQPLFSLLLTLVVLIGTLSFRYALPKIALWYNEQGVQYLVQNKVTSAIKSFERAVTLNPDYAVAHHNLGRSYEEILDNDKALSEYKRAIDIDPKFEAGLIDMARLNMVQRADYQKALDLLSKVFALPPSKPNEYAVYKNRGWAFLGLEQFELSERDLRRAVQISDTAEAHCMLGQALDGQSTKEKKDEAVVEWARCIELVQTRNHKLEPRWLAPAMAGLRK